MDFTNRSIEKDPNNAEAHFVKGNILMAMEEPYKAIREFNVAMEFMNEVAEVCTKMNHHPKWTNIYKEVECWLRTHDAGDVVTDADRELAQAMDRIASRLL